MKLGSSPGGAQSNGSDTGFNDSGAHSKMQHLDSSFDGPSASNNGKPAATADNVSDNVIIVRVTVVPQWSICVVSVCGFRVIA